MLDVSPSAPRSPRALALSLLVGLAALLGATACEEESDGIGAPCTVVEDCAKELICDVHEGQGTCQEGHGHGDGETADEDDDEDDDGLAID